MRIIFDNETDEEIPEQTKSLIETVFKEAVLMLDFKRDFEASVVFATDEIITEINKKHRNIDKPTDVLSFPLFFRGEYPEDYESIGDIIISIDTMKRQAAEYGHSQKREMCFLALHGFLHLLGYDHESAEDEKEMFSLQAEILDTLKIGRE